MAEKYGTIPPRFTKAWWEYVWEYYKWHIVGTIAALSFVGSFIHSWLTEVHYDLSIVHMNSLLIGDDVSLSLREELSPIINDIDENDEKNIEFISLTTTNSPGFEEQNMAMETKFMLTFTHDTTYVYLLSKEKCDALLQADAFGDYFLPIDEWDVDIEKNLPPEDSGDYAIDLTDNEYLKNHGFNTKDMRLLIRPYFADSDKKGLGKKAYENAYIIVNEILK